MDPHGREPLWPRDGLGAKRGEHRRCAGEVGEPAGTRFTPPLRICCHLLRGAPPRPLPAADVDGRPGRRSGTLAVCRNGAGRQRPDQQRGNPADLVFRRLSPSTTKNPGAASVAWDAESSGNVMGYAMRITGVADPTSPVVRRQLQRFGANPVSARPFPPLPPGVHIIDVSAYDEFGGSVLEPDRVLGTVSGRLCAPLDQDRGLVGFTDTWFSPAEVAAQFIDPVAAAINVDTTRPLAWNAIPGAEAYSLTIGYSEGSAPSSSTPRRWARTSRAISRRISRGSRGCTPASARALAACGATSTPSSPPGPPRPLPERAAGRGLPTPRTLVVAAGDVDEAGRGGVCHERARRLAAAGERRVGRAGVEPETRGRRPKGEHLTTAIRPGEAREAVGSRILSADRWLTCRLAEAQPDPDLRHRSKRAATPALLRGCGAADFACQLTCRDEAHLRLWQSRG